MASLPRRQRRVVDSDSEADTSRQDDSFLQATNGAKRVRLSPQPGRTNAASSVSEDDDDDDDDDDDGDEDDDEPSGSVDAVPETQVSSAQTRVAAVQAGADLDTYRPGAVVRIKLTDFVTYKSAELKPGPRLNMVIGPNGTGKSTLVCAICLGLGEGPQHLGRARDAAEYIKHGCKEATIEIELAGEPGQRNSVITRVIKRENKSVFTINGKQVPGKAVRKLAKQLSIQIDNLCQFLPQDKVCQFAALAPVELLQSTQRAAGSRELSTWHEQLKELRSGQKKLQASNRHQRETLQNLERRQEGQRESVERMKQREETKKRLRYLEALRPLPKCREVKSKQTEVKERRRLIVQKKAKITEDLSPILDIIAAKKEYHQKLRLASERKQEQFARTDKAARDDLKGILNIDEKMKELTANIEAEKKASSSYVADLRRLKQSINRIERQMEEGEPEFDLSFYTEKIRDRARQLNEIEQKASAIETQKEHTARELHQKKEAIYTCKRRLEHLDSQDGQQEEKLRKLSEDSYEAWQWLKLEKNQELFEKPVFGPPVVVCSVKDPRYASALESLMQRNDFCTITTQTRRDFATLQRILYREKGLYDITIKTSSVTLSSLRSPLSREELKELNFDGWASDYVAGPEPVLAMLFSENKFHTTPIMLRDITDSEFQHLENSTISMWISKTESYQVIRRREYGPSAVSTRVRQLRAAKLWTDQPVDETVRLELQREIDMRRSELDEVEKKIEEERSSLGRLKAEYTTASSEKAEFEREKAEKQTALTTFRALPTRLAQQNEKFKEAEDKLNDLKSTVEEMRKKQDYVSLEKAAAVLKYAKYVERLQVMHEDFLQVEIKRHEAHSDWEALKDRNVEAKRILEEINQELDQISKETKALQESYVKLFREVQAVTTAHNDSEEFRTIVETVTKYSVGELEADIDSAKALLDLSHEGHGSRFIEEFEKRQEQIDMLTERLEESQTELLQFDNSIAEIRGKWEPQLEALVQKINTAFSGFFARIGCAGQVSIDKADDLPDEEGRLGDTTNFDAWSIRIQVKFREHESLSVLDSHRQSGGERAVSTIFYLMALQSLSSSPFRVVDEINQGMDPRNERMVHERMVEIACGQADSEESGGQYFLITPKLLSGLHYQPGMTVLCIYSGEHMPADYQKLDFKKCVLRMKDLQKEKSRRLLEQRGGNGVAVDA
ncbi:Structural maintenance of chromosomes protein 5 [Ophidiomyces ophidiicola]|nr:Structural maintenance of chromosomes protein 5 [Ophidiomyces ophidiicola]